MMGYGMDRCIVGTPSTHIVCVDVADDGTISLYIADQLSAKVAILNPASARLVAAQLIAAADVIGANGS